MQDRITLAAIDRQTLRKFSAWLTSDALDTLDAVRQWLADAVAAELARRDRRHRPVAAAIEIPGEWSYEQVGQALALTVGLIAGLGELSTPALNDFVFAIHFRIAALAAMALIEGTHQHG